MLTVRTPLVVMDVGRAVRLGCRVERLEVTILCLRNSQKKKNAVGRPTETYSSKDVAEVPDLREGFSAVAASEVRNGAGLSLERILDLGQRVGSLV